MAKRGMFAVVEGPDGVGKSTVARRLAAERGAFYTREPTEALTPRLTLASWGDYSWHEHALLFQADRVIHLHDVIRPALEGGQSVVCDRYLLSMYVYQMVDAGHEAWVGGDTGRDIGRLGRLIADTSTPDLTIILDAPDEQLNARIAARGEPLSYYEQPERQRRVLKLYRDEDMPMVRDAWRVDASGSLDEVVHRCHAVLEEVRTTGRRCPR